MSSIQLHKRLATPPLGSHPFQKLAVANKADSGLIRPLTAPPQVAGLHPAAQPLIADASMHMRTPPGPSLAAWLQGPVKSRQVSYVKAPPATALDIQSVQSAVSSEVLCTLMQRGVSMAYIASALRQKGIKAADLAALVEHGAGPKAFAFLHHLQVHCVHRPPLQAARRILQHWGEKSEVVFAKLVHLQASSNLRNADELKSWISGMGAPRPASDGFATMLADAVDLVDAGHKIYIEEHPQGLGDIINETTAIAYQHKRVTAKCLKDRIVKAAEQLEGFVSADGRPIAGAPKGYRGIVQLDVRGNPRFNTVKDVVQNMPVARLCDGDSPRFSRLHKIQILLDNKMLNFDARGELIDVVTQHRDL